MMPETEPELLRSPRSRVCLWLGVCVLAGLLIAPAFYSMPPRMKFLGLHAWALAGCVGAACSWAAHSFSVGSKSAVATVSVLVTLACLLSQARWGYEELKRETARRTPMVPILQQATSPEQLAQSMKAQRELAEALVPTFTDFQRRRMNSSLLRRLRPLAFWGGELLTSAAIALLVSMQVQRRLPRDEAHP